MTAERPTHTIDTGEIEQLILRERQGRDRGWWARMRDAYAQDATVSVSWFQGAATEFVTRSEQMADRGDRAVHRLAPPVIDVHEDRAIAEVPAAIELRAEIGGAEVDLVSYTRLLYRAIRVADGWRLWSMTGIYERDTLTPVLPGVTPCIDTESLSRLRPTYRWLAYHLGAKGYPVDLELPGDDRPAVVETLYTEAFAWLGVPRDIDPPTTDRNGLP